MTRALLAAVVLLAVLTLLNLVLLFAVMRRLREHESRMADLGRGASQPPIVAPAGHDVGDLDVDLPALVGFFSPGCDACHERLPAFRDVAGGHPGGVLAVVVEDGAATGPLVSELAATGAVVVEEPDGPLATAFAVEGFPAFALVGADRRVRASGYDPGALV